MRVTKIGFAAAATFLGMGSASAQTGHQIYFDNHCPLQVEYALVDDWRGPGIGHNLFGWLKIPAGDRQQGSSHLAVTNTGTVFRHDPSKTLFIRAYTFENWERPSGKTDILGSGDGPTDTFVRAELRQSGDRWHVVIRCDAVADRFAAMGIGGGRTQSASAARATGQPSRPNREQSPAPSGAGGSPFAGNWRLLGNFDGEGGHPNLIYYNLSRTRRSGGTASTQFLIVDRGNLDGVRSNIIDTEVDCSRPVVRWTGIRNFDPQHRSVPAQAPSGRENPAPDGSPLGSVRQAACAASPQGEAVTGDVQGHADRQFAGLATTPPRGPREATYRLPGYSDPVPAGYRRLDVCGFRTFPGVKLHAGENGRPGYGSIEQHSREGSDALLTFTLFGRRGSVWPDLEGGVLSFHSYRADDQLNWTFNRQVETVKYRTAQVARIDLRVDGQPVPVNWRIYHDPEHYAQRMSSESGVPASRIWQANVRVHAQLAQDRQEEDRAVGRLVQGRQAQVRLFDAGGGVVETRTFDLRGLNRVPEALRSTNWRCEP